MDGNGREIVLSDVRNAEQCPGKSVFRSDTVYVIPFLSPPEPFLKIRRNAKWQQSDILQGTSLYLPPEDRSRGF